MGRFFKCALNCASSLFPLNSLLFHDAGSNKFNFWFITVIIWFKICKTKWMKNILPGFVHDVVFLLSDNFLDWIL